MCDEEDLEIVRRTLGGDIEAFGTVVEKYQRMVLKVAFGIVNNTEDAKDIVQSVFVKAYRSLPSFDPRHKLFSWLYRIAVNESLNFVHKRKRQTTLIPEAIAAGEDPQDSMAGDELSRRIGKALAVLTHRQRALLTLSLDGYSYRQIGGFLDLSEGKVKSRLFSARQKLKSLLEKDGLSGHGR